MAGKPTRAVYLIPIGEPVPLAEELALEQVGAYRAVRSAAKVAKIQVNVLQRRNAALEASGRVFAFNNFR